MNRKAAVGQEIVCWVPTCENRFDLKKKFFVLSSVSSKLKETWLAMATKPRLEIPDSQIFYCEDHFQAYNLDITIDNVFYSQQHNVAIPNNNMPARICRTCNEFMDINEPLFTMSTSFSLDIPKSVLEELKSTMVSIKAEPLYHMFRYCFSEVVVPSDPIPIICQNCCVNIWLFFAYKKRAIEVEDILGEGLTPEEYGQTVLCRTCSIERCVNFIPLSRDTELGVLLQKMFDKHYSPDIVPLRVCLNCYNTLQRINTFYKKCITTDKIIKRRALLNAKLKVNTDSLTPSPATSQSANTDVLKRMEKEKLILANLMLQYGQALRLNLHAIENWNPICKKLKEQGINHNVPSLINNWKKMQAVTYQKYKDNIQLSELDVLVLKFDQIPHNKIISSNDMSALPCSSSSSRFDSNLTAKNDYHSPKNQHISVIQVNSKSISNAPQNKAEEQGKILKKFPGGIELRLIDNEKKVSYPIEVQKLILRLLDEEYRDLLNLHKQGQLYLGDLDPWQLILARIAFKGEFPKRDLLEVKKLLQFMVLQAQEAKGKKKDSAIHQELLALKKNIIKLSTLRPSNVFQESEKPFTSQEKLELLHIMTQFKNQKGINGDPSMVDGIWPEILQMFQDKGSTRDMQSIKNNWFYMKEGAKKASVENKILDEIDRNILNFMKDSKSDVKKTAKKPLNKNGIPVNSKKVVVPHVKPGVKKYIKKGLKTTSIPSIIKKKRGRPVGNSFAEKLELTNAIRVEFDLTTPEERKRKSLWKDIIERVHSKHFPHMKHLRLTNLWGKLRISATVHEKDGSDIIDDKVWEMLKQLHDEKELDKIPIKNVLNGAENPLEAEKSILKKAESQFKSSGSPIKAVVSPMKAVPNVQGNTQTATTLLENSTKQATSEIIDPSRSYKRSSAEALTNHLPPDQNNSNNPTRSQKKIKFDLPKEDSMISKRTSGENVAKKISEDPPQTSSTNTKTQILPVNIERKLFMEIKDTYKEMFRSGKLDDINKHRIWEKVFVVMYESGFDVMPKQAAKKMWNDIKNQIGIKIYRGKPLSEFLKEVQRFLEKVRAHKIKLDKKKEKEINKTTTKQNKSFENNSPKKQSIVTVDKNGYGSIDIKPRSLISTPELCQNKVNEDGQSANKDKKVIAWSKDEKKKYLSAIWENLSFFHSPSFWAKIEEAHRARGYTNRTSIAIRFQLTSMRSRLERKKENNSEFDEVDKEVERLTKTIDDIKSDQKPNIVNTKIESTCQMVQQPPLPVQRPALIDLPYDYVSLQDLQQSTSWSIPPTLTPMVEKDKNMSFVVAKVEGGVNLDVSSQSHNVNFDEEEGSNEDYGFVCAQDLGMVINLTESDED